MPSFRPMLSTRRAVALASAVAAIAAVATQAAPSAQATTSPGLPLNHGDLLVATSTFLTDSTIVAGTTQLPPGCGSTIYDPCGTAVANGNYPYVFNNDSVDGSFGVTSPITLDELAPNGNRVVGSEEVPNSSMPGVTSSSDQMVTSFSSKSELAVNLSTAGDAVTFMGYDAAPATADVSNDNTPGDIDPTSDDPSTNYREVAELDANGQFHFTLTNAYSGDNGRAAILSDSNGADLYYTAGNAGNGANPEPAQVITGAGAQLVQPAGEPIADQTPGQPTAVGAFNVAQLGDAADKSGKDTNFRGITVHNNVVYYTKGSGSNGVDTVYFVDTTGTACPNGVGVPAPGAPLPTSSDFTYSTNDPALGLTAKNPGLAPVNMCVLAGFPTAIAKNSTDASDYPFGMWFANDDTLYVADEGAGDNTYDPTTNTYSAAAASTTAGLQKWVFDSTTQQWNLAYTLQSGLNLGVPYTVRGYPAGLNSGPGGTGLPWAPATGGLRTLTGRVNKNGTVTIWAGTSTISGGGDQGADPNELVSISDKLSATALPAAESFRTVLRPVNGRIVRGVAFTPGS